MLDFTAAKPNQVAPGFCRDFLAAPPSQRYIFGINEYADDLAGKVDVQAFIDDYTSSTTHLSRPVLKTSQVPVDGLVVSSLLGRPLTAEQRLNVAGLRHLDYFSFSYYAGLDLGPVRFWADPRGELLANQAAYTRIHGLLSDATSRDVYERIVYFRLSGNIDYLRGFTDRQREQYFEDFLALSPSGESFADIGGYDGFTSLEFIKRCPDYRAIHFFEPEAGNMAQAQSKLTAYANIHYYPFGLSDQRQTLRFSAQGSTSTISESGACVIEVDRLDDLLTGPVTFLKMDIEGAEPQALEGARQTILNDHPRLAIAVYHQPDDLWRIPEQILAIRDDYDLYLRHYTEGVVETVMFFMPRAS